MKAAIATAALLACLVAPRARAMDDAAAAHVLQFSNERLAATAARLATTASPDRTRADGTWITVSNTDQVGWTQGFFPGANWFVYDLTGDPEAKARADRWTRTLEGQKTNTQTHDLGFKMYLSFGHAFRSTGDPYYKQVLLTAAASLATRFNSTIGAVICCDWNPDWHRPIVTDTMMNLELLLWGAANGGPQSWRDMAVSHALKTLADMVRSDGSTYHVVDYSTSGAVLFRGTFQGYSNSSTWTRGQAWAIYGYTMLYRYTADPRMLAAARKVTDYYLSRLGNDWVPNWDFDAPTEHKDSSAAAAVASALFELSGFVTDPDRQRYLEAATHMLDELASPAYLSEGSSSQAILLHGSANVPAGEGIDAGLSYGDHYLLEAMSRRPASPSDAGIPDAGAPDAGAADAGGPVAGAPDAGTPGAPESPGPARGCATGGDAAIGGLVVLVWVVRRRRLDRTD
jgi:unsaturated chondroitin disaccharide hydrolase